MVHIFGQWNDCRFTRTACSKISSEKYCSVLQVSLLRFASEPYTNGYTLQQNNGTIHMSFTTTQFLEHDVRAVMDWQAFNLESNPKKGLWGIVVCSVLKD